MKTMSEAPLQTSSGALLEGTPLRPRLLLLPYRDLKHGPLICEGLGLIMVWVLFCSIRNEGPILEFTLVNMFRIRPLGNQGPF